MVGPSKSGYHRLHPDHAVVFNATIADEDGNRLWWGDVDLTDDEATLLELAQRVEIDLYLYFEGDSRRGFVKTIQRSTAVVVARADGEILLGDRALLTRDAQGRIVYDRSETAGISASGGGDAQG